MITDNPHVLQPSCPECGSREIKMIEPLGAEWKSPWDKGKTFICGSQVTEWTFIRGEKCNQMQDMIDLVKECTAVSSNAVAIMLNIGRVE